MEKYKYTGPTMLLGKNDECELRNGMEVLAEVNINIAKIKICFRMPFCLNPIEYEADVAAKYLEPVKPEAIHFDPKDDEPERKPFNTKAFFDELFEEKDKFPFFTEKIPFTSDTYFTPKKVMDSINDNFDVILSEMSDTHKAKNHDYGDSFTELYKECGSTYAYAHLKEKLNRIKTLRKSTQMVKKESMEDSLLDLASYAIMWVCELRKEKKDGE